MGYRSPFLARGQQFAAIQNLPRTIAATLNRPAEPWRGNLELYFVNSALRAGPPTYSLEDLSVWTLEIVRLGYATEHQPYLGGDWHQPLVKVMLPLLLKMVGPKDFWIAPETLAGTAQDEYLYFSPTVLYYVHHFEKFRTTIEGMWNAPVIIEDMPGRPGGVRIRPAPKIPPVVPLEEIEPNMVVLGSKPNQRLELTRGS